VVATVRASKAQLSYDAIKGRIVDGTYAPGSRLVLDQLARDLSVSPVPIREAIRRLEAEGWVVFQHNVGAQVASINLTQYGEAMQTLALLEGYATATAMEQIDDELLARAAQVNDRMRASLSSFDPIGFTQLNHDFHALLCGRCPNAHLRALLERQWTRMNHLRRSTFSLVPGRAQESVTEHSTLLDLIAGGAKPAKVEAFARQHKLNTLRTLAEHG
jgi:DNA-binding GntR family transcriptional regulator